VVIGSEVGIRPTSCQAFFGAPAAGPSRRHRLGRGGKEYRYYRCVTRDRLGTEACDARPLPAGAIEEFVVEQMRGAVATPEMAGPSRALSSEVYTWNG